MTVHVRAKTKPRGQGIVNRLPTQSCVKGRELLEGYPTFCAVSGPEYLSGFYHSEMKDSS